MRLEQTSAAYSQLDELVRNIPGWSPVDQLYTLLTMVLITSSSKGDILELGSWCGRSSTALGLAAQLSGQTKVYCVDLFPEKDDWHQNEDGTYSMTLQINGEEVRAYHHQTVWQEPFERDIAPVYLNHRGTLDIFRLTIEKYGLENVVSAYKGTLATFLDSQPVNPRFRLAFIDGDHGYDAVCADIQLVDSVLVPGGWICFDDAFTSYDSVNRAIQELIVANPRYELGQQMTRKLFIARKRLAE
jgi:predicted O-methyltransferase YrrM